MGSQQLLLHPPERLLSRPRSAMTTSGAIHRAHFTSVGRDLKTWRVYRVWLPAHGQRAQTQGVLPDKHSTIVTAPPVPQTLPYPLRRSHTIRCLVHPVRPSVIHVKTAAVRVSGRVAKPLSTTVQDSEVVVVVTSVSAPQHVPLGGVDSYGASQASTSQKNPIRHSHALPVNGIASHETSLSSHK